MLEQLMPNLYRIQIPLPQSPLKYLNSYVVMDKDRSLIIDTGLNREECHQAMLSGLEELGLSLERTDFFITHLHADHIALISRLDTSASTVYFNQPDKEVIVNPGFWDNMMDYAGNNGFPRDNLRSAMNHHPGRRHGLESLPPLTLLADGHILEAGGYKFQCRRTPGHTRGHTCLYEAEHKILIAGDHILIDISPNIQCWSDRDNPLDDYLNSLDKVYSLEVEQVLPGHRRLFTDHRARIDELKRHHHIRAEEVLDILGKGDLNAYQVAASMTWDLAADSWEQFPTPQKWFATGEAISHLRYVEEQGLISRSLVNDVVVFSLNGKTIRHPFQSKPAARNPKSGSGSSFPGPPCLGAQCRRGSAS